MQALVAEMGWSAIILLMVAAFATSLIHGATGIAGGFLLTVIAAPIIGLQAVVPVLSITLIISHASRVLFNLDQFDKTAFLAVIVPAVPFIVFSALVYGRLSGVAIAFILGAVVIASVPARRWALSRQLVATKATLGWAGVVYGGISGLAVGPGLLLVPILLGYGLSRQSFVATLATIALATNVIRIAVYGATDLLSSPYIILAVAAGIATIPGAWIGRSVLRRLTDHRHEVAVEWLVVLGGLGFFWMGLDAWHKA